MAIILATLKALLFNSSRKVQVTSPAPPAVGLSPISLIIYGFLLDAKAYERVIAQVVTFESWSEVFDFIQVQVKPEYDNWKGKEEIIERFLAILQKNFEH